MDSLLVDWRHEPQGSISRFLINWDHQRAMLSFDPSNSLVFWIMFESQALIETPKVIQIPRENPRWNFAPRVHHCKFIDNFIYDFTNFLLCNDYNLNYQMLQFWFLLRLMFGFCSDFIFRLFGIEMIFCGSCLTWDS